MAAMNMRGFATLAAVLVAAMLFAGLVLSPTTAFA
jgi:hypothetical protein